MTSITKIAFALLWFVACSFGSAIAADPYLHPDDPETILAAEEAVKRLGQDRGAISIGYKKLDIVGLSSAVSGRTVDVEETLKSLNAKKVGTEIRISLSGDVLFDFDKWDIRPEAEDVLAKIAGIVKELKKKKMLIEGHTDSKGSDSYNLKLSRKRADSVKKWFLKKSGLHYVAFVTKGYGESKPAASNTKPDGSDNPDGRAKNRRVEIRISK